MTATNGWPGKPGVPLNPEQDRWHWVKARPEKLRALREKFPALWTADNQHWIRGTYAPEYAAENWIYLGPVLSHDEATALQARVAELEGLAYGLMLAMSASGHDFTDILREARAAVEGKKDE